MRTRVRRNRTLLEISQNEIPDDFGMYEEDKE